MAGLQTKFTFEQQCNCKDVLFNDTTGVYNNPGNLGGYGVQNAESTDITFATIDIKKSTWDKSIVVTYAISSGSITGATVTDQFGNVRDVFPFISNTAFPFVSQNLDSMILYGTSEKDNLETGTYFVTYTVGFGIFTFVSQSWNFFVCQYNSCVEEAGIRLANRTLTRERAAEIFLTFDLIFLNVGLGNVSGVQEQIEAMDQLCNDCGCC